MTRMFLSSEIQQGLLRCLYVYFYSKRLVLKGYLGYATPETELKFLVFCYWDHFWYFFPFSSARKMYHLYGTYNTIF